MKGAKGECLFFDEKDMINKTKFDTKENCQKRIATLINIGAYSADTVSYKCKKCNFWHLGTIDQATKYGK